MKTQRFFFWIAALAPAALLASCGSAPAAASSTVNPDRLNADYTNALPVESQLILGTLKLEGTPQAVDSAEAGKLLPLYLLLQQLTASGSAAPQEMQATLEAIQAAMTPEQIHAISAMKLTQSDLTNFSGSGTLSGRTRTPNAGGGGNFPGGGGPEGGFGGGGQGFSQNQISTLRAERPGAAGSSGSAGQSGLLTMVIQLLQRKVPTATPTFTNTATPTHTPVVTSAPTPTGSPAS
jgi:hypothetical protein